MGKKFVRLLFSDLILSIVSVDMRWSGVTVQEDIELTVPRAKDIDELYTQTRGFEHVFTVDPPLADALNTRLDEPRVGDFAVTPRNYVRDNNQQKLADKSDLFKTLLGETSFSWKQTSYLIDKIVDCWIHTGSPGRITSYRGFDNPDARLALEIIEQIPSVFSAMGEMRVTADSTVVVDQFQFNRLDLELLPSDVETVDPFTDGTRALPPFRLFGTESGIIRSLEGLLSEHDPESFAFIYDSSSGYRALVESFLNAQGIPYLSPDYLHEDRRMRNFLNYCRKSLDLPHLKARDVGSLARKVKAPLPSQYEEYFLSSDQESFAPIQNLLKYPSGTSMGEVIENYEDNIETLPREFHFELDALGLKEAEFTERQIDFLNYYLTSYPTQVESDNDKGVLLADCNTTTYVDRPVVLHLGMDTDWSKTIPPRPWTESDREQRKLNRSFQILIQNRESLYLVQDRKAGEEVTPCYYFNELTEEQFDRFTDLAHESHRPKGVKSSGKGFSQESTGFPIREEETFSPHRLNRFVKSPKEYFFSQVIEKPDTDYLKVGKLFHELAEFYVNYPDFLEGLPTEELVEIFLEELGPLIGEYDQEALATEIRVGIGNLRRFFRQLESDQPSPPQYSKRESQNSFASRYDKPLEKEITEVGFKDRIKGLSGRIDLLAGPRIIDFKTGRSLPSPRSVVSHANVELYEKKSPDFQSILYLTHHRSAYPQRTLDMTFCYLLSNIDQVLYDSADQGEYEVNISYYPSNFSEVLPTREVYNYLLNGVAESNPRYNTLSRLGYNSYREFFQAKELPFQFDKAKLKQSSFAQDLVAYAKNHIGDYSYVEKGCRSALAKMVRFRKSNFFEQDMDRFEDFITEQLEEVNLYKRSSFPVGEVDYEDLDYKDLILHE